MGMGRSISFEIPTEPRPKLRAKMGRGRMYDPPENGKAADAIEYYCREQMHYDAGGTADTNGLYPQLEGPLYSVITFYLKKAKSQKNPLPTKKPDLDNVIKMAWDALEGTLYHNDSFIVLSFESKQWAEDGEERTRIEIGELTDASGAELWKKLLEPINALETALN